MVFGYSDVFDDEEDGENLILDLERQCGDGAKQDADGMKKDGADDRNDPQTTKYTTRITDSSTRDSDFFTEDDDDDEGEDDFFDDDDYGEERFFGYSDDKFDDEDGADDRSDPQYIPNKGTDDRILKIGEKQTKEDNLVPATVAKPTKCWQKAAACERWSHDRFDETEQAPKSKAELVSAYGYDIRNEDRLRRRHYGRSPNKYTRKWEDEGAYGRTMQQKIQSKLRPEDFTIQQTAVVPQKFMTGSQFGSLMSHRLSHDQYYRNANANLIMTLPKIAGKGRGRLVNQQYEERDETLPDPTRLNNTNNNSGETVPPLCSAENIDHILDNMFVKRPPYQPPPETRKSPPSSAVIPSESVSSGSIENVDAIAEIEKSVKVS